MFSLILSFGNAYLFPTSSRECDSAHFVQENWPRNEYCKDSFKGHVRPAHIAHC